MDQRAKIFKTNHRKHQSNITQTQIYGHLV